MIQNMTAIWKARHFLLALVRLDLQLRYRRSILGVGWSLLNPIAMTIVFASVFSSMPSFGGGNIPFYVPHLLIGMAVWGFLQQAALAGSRAFAQSESYIRQSPLPYGIYPLRVVLGQGIHSSIALALAVVVTALYRPETSHLMALVWIVPGVGLAFVAAWATATIFAFMNVYFQDLQHMLEVAAQLLFFLTPIIYPESVLTKNNAWWWMELNPVQIFLTLIRTPLMDGKPPTDEAILAGTTLTVVLVGLAIGTTAWLRKRVIFHL
jgi:ABC-type polysaccharide/polyol phosphate export permease